NDQMSSVTRRGLNIFFVGQDSVIAGDNTYAPYIRARLSADAHTWKICSWHKNQNAMQVGGKSDEMGWAVYETCKDLGAIIATAHEHSYHRTKTLTSVQMQVVDPLCPDPNRLCVASGTPGKSFVFVSGLGGNSVRDQVRCLPSTYPYGSIGGKQTAGGCSGKLCPSPIQPDSLSTAAPKTMASPMRIQWGSVRSRTIDFRRISPPDFAEIGSPHSNHQINRENGNPFFGHTWSIASFPAPVKNSVIPPASSTRSNSLPF